MMSNLVRKEPCPRCRAWGGDKSGDNLAIYTDHDFCFSCKFYRRTDGKSIDDLRDMMVPPIPVPDKKVLPDDAAPQIGAVAWHWLSLYGIMPKEAKDFLWSEDKQWLIFPFYGIDKQLVAWQARNFNLERPKPKYYTRGNIGDILHFIGKGDICVITEDLLSAIKVGRSPGIVGIPAFGSNVSIKLLTRLRGMFENLGVWLDSDKASEAVRVRTRASQFGFKHVFTVLTPKDPKEYDNRRVTEILCQAMET